MVKAKDLATVGFKYIGRSYQEMDCQKFVERCLKDSGCNLDLPGSNAWYRKMTWTGSPEECTKKYGKVPAGAFLFIHAFDGGEEKRGYHDGLGNASHIGIVTGTGKGAIHSSQSKGCVCESEFKGKTIKNGGWNKVGLWDEVDYGSDINPSGSIPPETGSDTVGETATVWAPSGSTVNIRKNQDKGSALVDRVPVGEKVTLEHLGEEWSRIEYKGKTGYIMTKFLIVGEVTPGKDEPSGDDPNMITVHRSILEDIYDQLGQVLGLRG